MKMKLSKYGHRFVEECGILRLMDDLGRGLSQPGVKMLGGGNPSHIPAVQEKFRQWMQEILATEGAFERLIGNYSSPEGDGVFRSALAQMFRELYGWEISAENIALTNGSQTAFFFLFNLLGGEALDGSHKKILLPLCPEYIGYADVGISADLFVSAKPQIDYLEGNFFKYRVDFDALPISDEIAAIAVSRPTNPTGNVLTQAEIGRLSALAKAHDIPFILDNAYGTPFPNILYVDAQPYWEPHIILCMSLSKLGLPGARTGIVIAQPEIITALKGMNAVTSLAPGNLGAYLALSAVRTHEIIDLSQQIIRPHYQRKMEQAVAWLHEELDGIDFLIHQPEGAFFLWLWFPTLPITTHELYEKSAEAGVIVVPGHYFFPQLAEKWEHTDQCIRLSYAQSDETVHEGIRILGQLLRTIKGN